MPGSAEQGRAALDAFASSVAHFRSTGTATAELTYYPAVRDLLDAVGAGAASRVTAIQHPASASGQSADLGLFAAHQLAPGAVVGNDAWERQVPEHGVVEVKAPGEPVAVTIASAQVARYTRAYGKTLVTNLREWRTVTVGADGRTLTVDDGLVLADTEASFWALVAGPAGAAGRDQLATDLWDYLASAIADGAPVASARSLSRILATHARRALHKVETSHPQALEPLRAQLETSLGVTFTDDEAGRRFFRSGLVQTLFYGVFATWVLTAQETSTAFDWHTVSYDIRLPPIITTLFEQYALPSNIQGLGIAAELDLSARALNRVAVDAFLDQFEGGTAIDFFYEPFLEAYDPDLRDQLGVWYTPGKVVDFMVAEVDRRLREDFGLPLGLADDSVVVLDPATGTGTFLAACLTRISRTLTGFDPEDPATTVDPETVDGLAAARVRDAATGRLFGFELLPAPFVVAHLRIGMLLARLGVPLGGTTGGRAGVYLTNSLTGWQPGQPEDATLFPAFAAERDAAAGVKQDARVLVVIGNPPYNAFAGTGNGDEERDLTAPYKEGVSGKTTLNDLYVRFFRIAERRIAETTGQGVVAYVTNRSYLRKPSFRTMRRHLLGSFDTVDVVDLNGDRDETGKRTPLGKPDPSIFKHGQSDGIAEGVAIAVLVRRPGRPADAAQAAVTYRALWGNEKAGDLAGIGNGNPPEGPESDIQALAVEPTPDNLWSFQPVDVGADYYGWTPVPDLAESPPEYGLNGTRGDGLVSDTRHVLETRMAAYLDPQVPTAALPADCGPLLRDWYGFDPVKVRALLTGTGPGGATTARPYGPSKVRGYTAGPFDQRFAYVEADHRLWVAAQPRLSRATEHGAWFLYLQRTVEAARNGHPVFATDTVGDQHAFHKTAYLLPNRLPTDLPVVGAAVLPLETAGEPVLRPARPNLSTAAREYLAGLGLDPDDQADADLVFLHVLAFTGAPVYSTLHGDALRQAYPRVPLPADTETLRASASLGRRVKDLFDVGVPAPIGGLLGRLGALRRADGTTLDPARGDLEVTVTWGALANGAVMPKVGITETAPWTPQDMAAAAALTVAGAEMTDPDEVHGLLGQDTLTVHLNDQTRLVRVPRAVWETRVGGKQVLKKWLSYRTRPILGRSLTLAEAGHLTATVRKIAALLLLGPALDANYESVAAVAVMPGREQP